MHRIFHNLNVTNFIDDRQELPYTNKVELTSGNVASPLQSPAEFDRLPASPPRRPEKPHSRTPMTSCKKKSASYAIGYGKPPMHTRFRKGQSGNPGGRPRRAVAERAKVLALREAYRTVTVKEGGRVLALPAIQAILRSQITLAAKGNVQAQRAVLAVIQTTEYENVVAERAAQLDARYAALAAMQTIGQEAFGAAAPATQNTCKNMSYTEAAQRVMFLLRLDEKGQKLKSEDGRPLGRA